METNGNKISLFASMVSWAAIGGVVPGGLLGLGIATIALGAAPFTSFAALLLLPFGTGLMACLSCVPFAFAVSRLYGDQPVAQDELHRLFWCTLSFLAGLAIPGTAVCWLVADVMAHAG